MGFNRDRPIPGVTGRRVPGQGRMPGSSGGKFQTNVPFQAARGGEWGSAIFREYHRQQVRDSHGRFAGGWSFSWQGLASVDAFLWKWIDANLQDIKQNAEKLKDEMVAYMQAHAPWEDETGNARRELQGKVLWEDDTHFTIWLGHGPTIYYGIWLEVRWGGRYAIILPTIQHFQPLFGGKLVTAT